MNKMYFKHSNRTISYAYNDQKKAQTLIFIHGAGSNMRQFEEQTDFFNTSFNCLNVTLYGHDNAQADIVFDFKDFELSKLAEDIILLLKHLNIQSLHIVGNSVGGLIGYEIIKSDQFDVLSITTFGTAPKLMYPKWIISLISKIDAYFLQKNPIKYLRFVTKASSKHEHTITKMTDIMIESKHAAPFIRSQIGRYDYLDVIEKMEIPYLLLIGPHDKSINKVLRRYIKKLNINRYIKMIKLEQSGHFMNLDQSNDFNQIIMTFVNNIQD